MKNQANRNYNSNDDIMTPKYLAKALIKYFKPKGKILEPCKGTGNFLEYLPKDALWCEIKEGKNFFNFYDRVDWIITNPPWSQIRNFLRHSLKISNNIIFLMTINHLWTRARLRDIKNANFGIREIIIFNTPKEFPQLGFQLGAINLKKNYNKNYIKFSELKIE